jgi:Putative DNA-binding domain
MPSLRDLQLRFAAALAGDAKAAAVFAVGPASAGRATAALIEQRLAIYRGNGRANYRNALAATFPVVARLTGLPFFHAVVDAFVATHPPAAGDLNVYGDRLPGFLRTYPPAAGLPYLADVAALEWAIDEANRAADAPRVPDAVLAALAMAPAERLPQVRLTLDPSCRLVASAYPILRIWRANQLDRAGDERIGQDEGGVALIVRRDAPGVALESLAASEHAWLVALARGEALGAAIDAAVAVDAAFELGTALRQHIAVGTIIAAVVG